MPRIVKRKVKPVHMLVHPDFFNRVEMERKKIRKMTGVNLGKLKLTKVLSDFKVDLKGRDNLLDATKKPKQKR